MQNPYTLTFGREPVQYISRIAQTREIVDAFSEEEPSRQMFVIMGVRGSGKTVLMTEISNYYLQRRDWVVVELNPESDLLQSLGAKLYSEERLAGFFESLNISMSLFGVGVGVTRKDRVFDIETAVGRMLEVVKKSGKRVLITIDEATNNANVRRFASAFQIFIRQRAPVFLLVTGLYENISELQDVDNLTFLYRAPKCLLKPLNTNAIVENYRRVLGVEERAAREMAGMTRGYPFAFQVLGYLTYERGGDYRASVSEYRQYLEEYVYEKIWSELSPRDREIAHAIAVCPSGKISEVRALAGVDTNHFNPYRKRLIKKGIVEGTKRGYVRFVLPFFEEFVISDMEEIY